MLAMHREPVQKTLNAIPDLEEEVALNGLGEVDRVQVLRWSLSILLVMLGALWLLGIRRTQVAEPRMPVLRMDVALDPGTLFEFAPHAGRPGDPKGTNTVDPEHLKGQGRRPSLVPPLAESSLVLPQKDTISSPQPAWTEGLPVALGGNGIPRGDGGGIREELQPIHQVWWTNQSLPGVSAVVRLTVGADGVPLEATPISGPPELYPRLVRISMQWRFRVTESMKTRAPFYHFITFRCW